MPSRPKLFHARPQQAPATLEAVYDQRRGSARARGYSAQWDRASALFRANHPLCLGCEAIGRVVPSQVTDHVEPHKGELGRFWDAAMWQPACAWHHDVVKQLLERMYGKGEIGVAELWLNSATAVRVTLDQLPFVCEGGYQNSANPSPGPAL